MATQSLTEQITQDFFDSATPLKKGAHTTATKASHYQPEFRTVSPPKNYQLQIDDLHPRDSPAREPKRWEILHDFDRTQKQTREFLREALEEELEQDPECTFQPQLSEMSQLIMRGSQYQGFLHRNECWQKAQEGRLSENKKAVIAQETESGNFMPLINKESPQTSGPSVVTKKGVARYLNRLKRAELNKTRQCDKTQPQVYPKDSITGSYASKHESVNNYASARKPQANKYSVTTPKSPFTRDNTPAKPLETIVPQENFQSSDNDLMRAKQQKEHQEFLKTVNHDSNHINVKDSRYAEAINQLHNQILSLELECDSFNQH